MPEQTSETRAVRHASESVQTLMAHMKEKRGRFMEQARGPQSQHIHDAIAKSATATRLVAEGYPLSFAHRVARLESE